MSAARVATVQGLTVTTNAGVPIVEGFSLAIDSGEIVGLVGESGSGKTTASLALLGFAARGVRIASGSVEVSGEELVGRAETELRRIRGRSVSYVPQDPSSALNPSLRVGDQVAEMLRTHAPKLNHVDETARVLDAVHLPASQEFLRRFPHQLSGGQQQRLAIAIALVGRPPLVVLDEPTTGLDVITQARILDELRRLRTELGIAMVYVSHDLAVVSSLADRVAVMYAGAIVEEGSARDVFSSPAHPYTRGLVASIPDYVSRHPLNGIPGAAPALADRPSGCPFAARCPQVVERCSSDLPALTQIAERRSVRCIRWESTPPLRLEPSGVPDELDGRKSNALLQVDELVVRYGAGAGAVVAARDVSFSIGAGESVALVGESGSGKTTIARSIAGLVTPASGTIRLSDVVLAGHARDRTRKQRQHIQIVFQNPYDSLNPRRTVLDAIARPASLFRGLSGREASGQALELLEAVGVRQGLGERFPRELSGGERQRVAIARALAAQPEILVCDEVTSALDVSVQATVLALLGELRVEFGLTLLFISHDLGVVATVCDRALVLQDGVVRETGSVTQLLEAPQDEYTRLLLESAPRLELAAVGHDGSVG